MKTQKLYEIAAARIGLSRTDLDEGNWMNISTRDIADALQKAYDTGFEAGRAEVKP